MIERVIRVEATTIKGLEEAVEFAKDVFSRGNLAMGGTGTRGIVIYQLIYF